MKVKTINRIRTGDRIRYLVEKKGLKQREVAKACGLESTRTVRHWFDGDRIPGIDALVRLADLLEVGIDDLLVKDVEEW